MDTLRYEIEVRQAYCWVENHHEGHLIKGLWQQTNIQVDGQAVQLVPKQQSPPKPVKVVLYLTFRELEDSYQTPPSVKPDKNGVLVFRVHLRHGQEAAVFAVLNSGQPIRVIYREDSTGAAFEFSSLVRIQTPIAATDAPRVD